MSLKKAATIDTTTCGHRMMPPLTFEPLIKQIRWGGRRLGTHLGKSIGTATDYAESWEISDQRDGESIVSGGVFSGQDLRSLLREWPDELLGRHRHMQQFPLLIKFLDANDWLSLQVHPNDEQAKRAGDDENGKTEAWVILHAEPDSRICAGLKSGVTRNDFLHHLESGSVEQTLHMIPAVAGDCIFVPAGTVHALGPGIVLAEIQQQSNITYRLHDWGRMGTDGRPREIHVAEAMSCIDFDRGPVNPVNPVALANGDHHFEELVRCDYFVVRRHSAVDDFRMTLDDRFRIVMLLEGSAVVETDSGNTALQAGQTALLPAATRAATIRTQARTTLLEILHP